VCTGYGIKHLFLYYSHGIEKPTLLILKPHTEVNGSTCSDKPLFAEREMSINFATISGTADDHRARSLFFEIMLQVSVPSSSNCFEIIIWYLQKQVQTDVSDNGEEPSSTT
jgi:hypothetical protein